MVTKRKRKSARERGYLPMREVAAGLRSLAAQMEQNNKGRLAKVSLNVWYEDPEPIDADSAHPAVSEGRG